MPPLFHAVKTTQASLEATAITSGNAYFVQDSERLFFDYNNSRTEIRDIVVLDTEADRTEMLAPKNKFYFVLETTELWLYKAGTWYQISGKADSISLAYQSFNAGTEISKVQLDQAVSDAASIVSVNVDNTVLLKSTYTLGDDLQTITFTSPITAELGIDVIYSITESGSSRSASSSVNTLTTTKSRSTVSTVEKSMTLTADQVYQLSLTGHTSLSFGGWTEGTEQKITLYLTVPDSYTLTLPADVKWKNGVSPSLEVDGVYIMEFKSIDGGSTVFGSVDKYI
jgi:hypothetical protein